MKGRCGYMKREKQAKSPIRVRRGALILAVLLLCLPGIHVLDLTPDFIAYLLLISVFAPYAVLNEHMAEAVRMLEKMALISGAQLLSVFWIFGFLSVNPLEQPMATLLCCFVFAFFKIMIGFPLCQQLCDGLIHLDTCYDGTMYCVHKTYRQTTIFGRKRRFPRPPSRYNITERMCHACQIFLICRVALNTLPEFAALSSNAYDDQVFNWYEYVSLFRGATFFVSLIFGVWWLIHMLRYIHAISKDKAYYERLSAAYAEEDRLHPERRTRRMLRVAFLMITLYAVFTIDFSLDNFNILPDFLGAIALLIMLHLLRPYLSSVRMPRILISVYALISLGNYILTTLFFTKYRPESILRSERIRVAYIPVQVATVIESIALTAVMVCLLKILFEIIDRYTGYEIESTANYSREEKLAQEHRELKRRYVGACVFGALTVLCNIAYVFLRPTLNFMWLFGCIVPAVFAVLVWVRLSELQDHVDSKFMLM